MGFAELIDRSAGDAFTLTLYNAIKTNMNDGVMRPIGETILSSAAASISFGSIPSTYQHLLMVVDTFGDTATDYDLVLRLNGASTAIYNHQNMSGITSTAGASATAGGTYFFGGKAVGSTADQCGTSWIWVSDIQSGDHKCVKVWTTYWATTAQRVIHLDGVFRSTSTITSISIAPTSSNLGIDSRAVLYGMPEV